MWYEIRSTKNTLFVSTKTFSIVKLAKLKLLIPCTNSTCEIALSKVRLGCSEAYLEPSEISKMDLFVKIVMSFQPVTIFAKSSILDVLLGSKYASVYIDIRQNFGKNTFQSHNTPLWNLMSKINIFHNSEI